MSSGAVDQHVLQPRPDARQRRHVDRSARLGASSAHSNATARSRDTSPDCTCRCSPMNTRPSGLVIAGHGHRQHRREGDRAVAVLARPARGPAAAAPRRPAPARAARSTPARRPALRTGGRRRRRGSSGASRRRRTGHGGFSLACSRRPSLGGPAAPRANTHHLGRVTHPRARPIPDKSEISRSRRAGRQQLLAADQAAPSERDGQAGTVRAWPRRTGRGRRVRRPSRSPGRRRWSGPGRRSRRGRRPAVRGPAAAPPSVTRISRVSSSSSRQATRITSPGSGAACRTALPTSSAAMAMASSRRSSVSRASSSWARRWRATCAPRA